MRWLLLLANLTMALLFYGLGAFGAELHRTHAYSTYRHFVQRQAIDEARIAPPDVSAEELFRRIGDTGFWYRAIALLAGSVCVANGVIHFRHHSPARLADSKCQMPANRVAGSD